MATIHINLLAVLVAGVINMIVGAIWYAPSVFGKIWAKELGMKADGPPDNAAQGYLVTFIGALVMSYVLALVIGYVGAATATDGLVIGLWLWLGFAVTIPLNELMFGKKTWNLFFLNAAYYLVVLAINGVLLASWK